MKRLKALFLAGILTGLTSIITGQNTYYWVGGQGEWSDVTHWATTSGGNIHPANPPTASDNVVFDNNSFANGDTVFIYNSAATCANMTWNTTRWVTLYSTQALNIYGSFTWSNTVQANLSGGIYFSATSPGKTIDTKGVEIGGTVFFNGVGGEWTLLSPFEVFFQIYLNAGSLITNNYPVRAMHFYSTTNFPRALHLGNSVFTCTLQSPAGGYSWVVEYNSTFTLSTGGSSLIRFTADGLSRMKAGDGFAYDNITFQGRGVLISNGSSYKNVQFGTYKPSNPLGNYTGRIGEGLTLANNNIFNNVTFYDHGFIHGNGNNVQQILQFRGNGNILSGSNQCHTLQQYRYYPYMGGTQPNTLTLQEGETQTILNTIELIGTILCEHTIIKSTGTTHAIVFTTNPITLEYVDLRYLHGKNTPDPAGAWIAPDTAWTSLNTNNINWVFPDNYHLPQVDSATITDVSPCHNSTNGVIVVHASGGLPSSRLQYQLSGPVNRPWQNDSVFANLPQGTYTLQVREVRGTPPTEEICFVSGLVTVTVGGPTPISITGIDVVNPTCYGSCNGSLTIHASGGVRPYEYSINWNAYTQTGTFQSDSTFTNLCAGTYNTFMVRHSGVCYYSGTMPSVTISNPPDITITSSVITGISCHNAGDGQIQISATGGTGTLTYTLQPGNISNQTGLFTGLGPGTYNVLITDANGCTKNAGPYIFTNPPLLQITSEQFTHITCHDANDGTITITATGGTGTLTYTLNPGSVSNQTGFFSNLSQGTYTVTVTDAHGCTTTSNPITIQNPPALSIISLTSTNITCYNYNDGTISISATGGTGTLTYTINPLNLSNNSGYFTNLGPGTYTVTIKDGNNCQLVSPGVTILNPSPVTVSTSDKPASCYGLSDGCAIAMASGGTGGYTYTWNVTPPVINDSLCSVPAGIYQVNVTDANGCPASAYALVSQPTAITVTFSTAGYANPTPPPPYLYSAQAFPSGGTPPYTHHWETGSTTDQIIDVTEGIYTDTIRDANGCIKIDSVYLQSLSCQIAAYQNVTCFGYNNGWALAQGLGGNTPYTYAWRAQGNPTVIGTNAFINNLAPGTYEVTITDANSISVVCSVTITEPPLLQVSLTPVPPMCNGQNGLIQSTVTGGSPYTVPPAPQAYNYLWSNLQTTPQISVPAGSYSLIVTDSLGCQATASTLLTEPPALTIVSASSQNITCHNANDGSITVSATGGTGSLTYTLTPGGISNNTGQFTGLSAGTYTVTVEDANGCQITAGPLTIVNPAQISITSATVSDITCHNANDGSILISATGGTGTLTYTLNPGSISNNTGQFTGLSAGTYTVVITDANLCSITSPGYTIINPDEITITSTVFSDPLCYNASNGSITVSATGGTGTLTYTLQPTNISNQTGIFPGLAAGTYTVEVTDDNLCLTSTGNIILANPPQLILTSVVVSQITCHNANNGSITVAASGGTGTLTYTLTPGGISNNTGQFTGLSAGTYTVAVEDANGCQISTGPLSIVNPAPLAITSAIVSNITCHNANNGSIVISATGGTGTLTYTLNPGGISNNTGQFTGLSAGTYTITISDANLCSITSPGYTIINPDEIIITSVATSNPLCYNASNGSITVSASGGTGTLTYTLQPGNISNQTGVFTGLAAGTYIVWVSDINSCQTSTGNLVLNNPALLQIQSITKTDMTCHNIVDGTITVVASGGTGPLTYTLYPDITINYTGYFTGLDEDDYYVVVRDINNCQATSSTVHINNPDTIHITAQTFSNPLCAGAGNGTITITATGGTAPLTYWLQPGSIPSNTGTFTGLNPGNYTVIVTDVNLCPSDTSNTFTLIDPPAIQILSESFTPITCHNAADGTIEIVATGGTGTLTYTLNPLNISNQTGLFTNLNAGTYTVTVSDQNGCTLNSSTFVLTNPPAVTISSVVVTQPTCFGLNNGTISISASGGTGNLLYSINGGITYSTTSTFTGLAPGWYNVYVMDANGCYTGYSLNPVQLSYPPQLQLTFSVQNPTCNGCSDGSITALPSGGTPGYTHHWNTGATTATITGLPAHVYFVDTLRDANGCIVIDSVMLSEPGQFIVSTQSSNVSCFGGNNGWIQTTVSGGTPPYAFVWKKEPNPGTYSTNQNINNLTAGVYTLTVTDAFGYAVYDTVEITQPPLLIASLTISHDSLCPESHAGWMTAQVSGGTQPYNYLWSGGISLPSRPDSIFNLGPGTINLLVTDAHGCQTSAQGSIQAFLSPQAAFTVGPVCRGNPSPFDDQSVPGSGALVSWFYNFGDGQTLQVNAPSNPDITHIYANAGSFNATLVVTDINGCQSNTATATALVNPIPTAAFTFDTVCLNLPTHFTDLSTSGAGLTSWFWNFGDGTSGQQNPQHIFTSAGTHSVKLIVADAIGCSDSVTHNVMVWPLPQPAFTYADSCTGTTLWFTDQTLPLAPGIASWHWNFGDGYFSTLQNPQHTYALPNTSYPVTLTVVNTNGCQNNLTQNVVTTSQLGANFTFNTACLGTPTLFTATSNLPPAQIAEVNWYLGDGSTASGLSVSHTYTSAGFYNVIMVMKSTAGCEQTVSKIVSVVALPQPSFTWTTGCPGEPTQFTDQSISVMSPIVSWAWDFGDGSVSSLQHPSHTYLSSGTYAVTLTVTNANGCSATVQQSVTIDPLPMAFFSWSGVCEGVPTQFTDLSNGYSHPIQQWYWSFGDGWFSSLQHPVHTYTTAGTYNVTLQVWNAQGCTQDTTLVVTINTNPTAWFSYTQTCAGTPVSFTDESTSGAPISQWAWNFGDGGSSALQHPQHIFAGTGPYNVQLTVTDINGCTSQATRPVTNYPKPTAAFTYTAACTGSAIQFNDASLGNGSLITSWLWDFGDGQQSVLQNPTHVYLTPGAYLVTLIVTTQHGCSDTVIQTVSPYTPPTADFTWNSPCVLTATQFTDQSVPGTGNISSYLWTIDHVWNSILQNPTYSFTTTGAHTVRLIVTDIYGCKDTLEQTVLIDSLPIADFTWNTACANAPTQFTDLSNPTGSVIASWNWIFGDGGQSSLQHPAHVYSQGGFYPVKLTVTKPNGCAATAIRTVVIDSIPEANFTFDTACAGLPTHFYDLTTVYGSPVVQYEWNFGDPASGAANVSYLQNPQHTFSAIGTYQVRLVVTNALGCTDTIIKAVNAFPGPVADFTFDTACFGQPTHLTDLTQSVSPITSWLWDFGGGNTSTQQNPVYTFPNYGLNPVTLTITNQNGCVASVTKQVLVDQLPVAGFTWSNPCNTNIVQFTDATLITTSPIVSWHWDFGDGSYSTVQNPQHVFVPNQSYNVTLTVSTQAGCSDSHSETLTIIPGWSVDFAYDTVCFGDSTHFVAQVLTPGVNVASVQWNFGDGSTGTGPVVSHKYNLPGLYQVMMQVTDTAGCSQGASHLVEVYPLPQPAFTFQSTCADSTVSFFDQTPGIISQWQWDFGDGNGSSLQNPVHTYAAAGNYTVSLAVTDAQGCQNQTSQQIILFDKPTAAFSASTACLGSATQFTDQSFTASGTITSWTWHFGDGTQSSLQNPTHTYASAGTYQVTLVVTNSLGCADSVTLPVQVLSLPSAGFAFTNACLGTGTQFTDQSVSANGIITQWLWNFGDGNGSNLQNPIHTYAFAGTFNTTLTVTDAAGCQASLTQPVVVMPLPTAQFSFTNNLCGNTEVQFTDQSSGNGANLTSWLWDFGDGNSSTLQNPTHLYASPGAYVVSLQVTNANGCSNTTTRPLVIGTPPVAAFTYANNCYPQATQFTDQSTTTSGTIVQWKWNFGDPASGASNTSTQQNPVHVFSTPGVYTVQLIIITSSACSDTVWQTISVEPGPTADFSFSTSCVGASTTFTDLSTPAAYPIISWLWNFGDGNTSSQPNPSHTYLLGGQYMVTLTVTDANGCQASRTRMVPVYNLPTAQFQFSNECQNQNTYFTDYSNGAGAAVVAWSWDFGDPLSGGNNYSTLQNPTHVYTSTGLYQVTLTVTNANGCSNSVTQPVFIIPSPVADFEANNACSGSPVYFNNLSYSVGSNINQWYWDFGDGTTSTLQFPYHTFPGAGVYNVSLTVTNTNGCTASVLKPVTVNPLPLVNFDYLRPNCAGDSTYFLNLTSYAGGGGAAAYLWNLGDGTTSTAAQPVHMYPAAGTYAVTLTVTDNNGCTAAQVKNVTVYSSPNAAFIFNHLTCSDVQFTDMSYDPQLSINGWYWNFNDPGSGSANQSTQQNPVHTFSQPGVFNVRLMVVNSEGCSDTTFRNVQISTPVADFRVDSSTLCAGAGTQFIDLSYSNYGTITSWLWNFGDGTTSTQPNPIHQYSSGGIYWVTLTVQTSLGCSGTITRQVIIYNQPIANFSFTAPNCPGQTITFTDLSSAPSGATITQWNWDFGNGSTSTLQNPTNAYATAGNYLVQLKVTDSRGCQATRIRAVKVYAQPVANFSNNITQCNKVTFTDLSLSQDTLINAWLWNFGDPASGFNNVSTLKNPVHIYNQPGTYQVTLVVWTAAGCADTMVRSVTITAPQANFTYTAGCQGDLTQFTDLSVTNGIPIIQWQWQFGDGGTSTSQNPVYTYQNPGNYLVSLLVTNSQGCQSNVVKLVTIPASPIANFTFDTPCQGDSTHFTDASMPAGNTPIVSWNWDFGDGSTSTLKNPAHLYAVAGTYNVSLQITDANGCRSTKNQQVIVYGKPLANFNFSIPNCDTVFFTDASAGGGSPITLWRWNFGDPASGMFNTSTQQNPWHLYTLPGTYQVRLIVTNSNGCSDTIVKPVLYDPFPQPDFTFDIACSGDTTHFQALNTAPNVVSYAWNFGDGYMGTGPAPVHVYANPGTYSVTLVVTNNNLCSNHITKAVPVIPTPVVNFTWNPVTCAGSGVSFINQTQGNGGTLSQYLWRFGDGSTSAQANPVHTYASAGTYQVTLLAWNSNGCVDSLSKTITIQPLPNAAFTSNTVCKGQATQFTDLSQPQGSPITGWLWNFGDGSTLSGIQNPQHVYASAGTYNVTLTVTAANGCQATATGTALVNALPVVNFTTQSDTLCAQDTVFFTNLTQPQAGTSYQWYFGDPGSGAANTSTQANPFHVYNAPGTYVVTLIATTGAGCQNDTTRTLTIRHKPVVNFIYTVACSNDTTFFTDLSYVPGGTPMTAWNWNFGDGTTSTVQHPAHVYSSVVNDTTFTVTLTAYSAFGCSNTKTQQVPVYGPPVAAFSAPSVCQGTVTYFTSQATTPSGIITSWNWDFGDSTYSTLPNPTHLYAQADTFMVRLIVSNSNGCFDTTVQPVVVYPLPLANFIHDTVCFGDTTHFTDLSIIPYGEINSWYWTFGDPMSGVYDTSTLQNPVHKFTHPGLFMVTLMAGDTNGCAATITLPVKVDSLPIPQFAYTPATCQNTAISFTDQSQATDNPIASWTWRFGDGSDTTIYAPNSPNIQHVYTNLGLFMATLITTDTRGCTDSVSHVLEIYPLPQAAFTYKDTTCTAGLVYFKDQSLGVGTNVTGWMWDFNYPGQSYSTQQNPYYFYPITNASYTVMLAITDARGCRDTVFDTIYVKPGLQVDFALQNNCYGDTVTFTPQVIQPAGDTLLQAEWTFGDGQTSTQYIGQHVYPQPGLYYVQMKAWNQNGCLATAFKPIIVDQPPLVAFTAPPAGCQDPTVFTDFSQPNSDSIVSWHWRFGDGTDTLIFAPNSPHVTHLYGEEGGVYQASLTVTNSNGCSATLQQEVIRFSCLQAGFNTNPTVCSGQPVVIIDMSAAGSGAVTITNWFWDLGDGTQISSPVRLDTLVHTYNSHGTYTIRQIITANTGTMLYMDTAEMNLTVYPGPRAAFVHTPGCYGVPVVFKDKTLTPGAPLTQWLWNFGDGTTSTLQNPVHQFADTSKYTVVLSVANTFGCTDTASAVIKPALLPGAMLAAPGTVFCADTITLTLSETSNQQANRYIWNFGDGTTAETTIPQVKHTFTSGTWDVMLTVYSTAECPNADTLQITIRSLPVAEFSFKPDSVRPLVEEARFLDASFGTSSPIRQWHWSFGDGRDTLAVNPLHKYADTGTYAVTLRVTDENGCVNQITKNLRVFPELRFFIPNAFTPNQNGRNEVFKPLGKYFKPGKYLFQVYNRWGELVFETTDPEEGWDGKFKGVDSPVGVYIWTVTVYDMFNDKEFYKGSVLLLR